MIMPRDRIYFISAGKGGPIKVGHSCMHEYRIRSGIQPHNHEELIFLGCINGGYPEETTIKRMFAKDCIRGEWFRPTPRLMAFIRKSLNGAK